MVILHIKPQEISILQTKKSVLSGSETAWASQNFAKTITKDGDFTSIDVLASAIKEAAASIPKLSDKELVVVLDHSLYSVIRSEIPTDVTPDNYHNYLKDSYIKSLGNKKTEGLEDQVFEMIVKEFESKKFGFVYTFQRSVLEALEQASTLLELKVTAIVPEHLAYYALFEKTLRLDKHEHIMYVQFENESVEGYYFDTFGPLPNIKPWKKDKVTMNNVESILKDKADNFAKDNTKLNRVVIAGSDSDKIRQDTFTKNVGVWTNPLKRIVPHFYQEYLNLLKSKQESAPVFPALKLAALFGGFITAQDGKAFPFQKIGTQKKIKIHDTPVTHSNTEENMSTQSERKGFRIPKEIILFVVIFIITFSLFYFIAASRSEGGVSVPFLAAKPTETPPPTMTPVPPTPTPTVEVKREEVNVKVLNGTGVAGQAGGLKAALLKAGYVGVVTDNADKYDYTQSVVQIKSDKEFLKGTISEDIKGFITDPKYETLEKTEKADVVIIIGKDIK
ncbi:MAG: LytR C-terminal domain-containing protein [Patescibacteria group bacterium]